MYPLFFFSYICLSEFRWGYFSLSFKHGISNHFFLSLFLELSVSSWNFIIFSLFFFLLTLGFFYLLFSCTSVINKMLQFSTRIFVLLRSCFPTSFLCCSFVNAFLLWQSTKTLFDLCYLYNTLVCFTFQTFSMKFNAELSRFHKQTNRPPYIRLARESKPRLWVLFILKTVGLIKCALVWSKS